MRRATPRRRTPTLLQMEATECGAAALGIVLGHFGRWLTLEELRLACNVSRDGSSAGAIARAARGYGLEVEALRAEPHHLRGMAMPVVVHWGFDHFLVVDGFRGGRVFLNDPAEGPRTVSAEEFDRQFTGVVLAMAPGPGFRPAGRPPTLLGALRERLAGSSGALAFVLMISLALVVPGLLVPVFTQIFIDQILVNQFRDWLLPLLGGMAGAAVLMAALTFLQREVLLRLETRLALAGAVRFVQHVARLPIGYFNQRHAAEVAGRVAFNDRVARLMTGEVGAVLCSLLTGCAYLVAMLFYAPPLAAIVVAFGVGNMVLLWGSSRALDDDNRRLVAATAAQASFAKQGLQMIESYKSGGAEQMFRQRLGAMNARVLNLRQSVAFTQIPLSALPSFTGVALGGLTLAAGGTMVIEGRMTIGMLVAFQALMGGFLGPLGQLMQLGARMQDGQAYLRILDDTLRHPVATEFRDGGAGGPAADGPEPYGADARRLVGAVALRDVDFAFVAGAAPLLTGISFEMQPGERLGIVGASGSGKSTLAALVAGIEDPSRGIVEIDGLPIRGIPRTRLRHALAYVDQRSAIFEGTIRDNITLWDNSLPDERVVAAARAALIHETILGRPGGYASRVAEAGTDLSGGQRARLEIARALVREPRILVLDEATAALDAATEARLFANLGRLGCTMLVIAHRFSAIRGCDRVIMLDRGAIVEAGEPASLMARSSVFRRLMRDA